MLFNSLHFLLFLPVVLAAYAMLPHRGQNRMLLIASYLFYGWWDERFLFLIALSTVVDYWCGLTIGRGRLTGRQRLVASSWLALSALCFVAINWSAVRLTGPEGIGVDWSSLLEPLGGWALCGALGLIAIANLFHRLVSRLDEDCRRKVGLWTSIVVNLTVLGVFKYYNFFVGSAEDALYGLGFDAQLLRLDIVLPVGISFYTFQTMCYTIDVYRRKLPPTDRFLDFALYVAYFPQLVAGPIERPNELLPRLQNPRRFELGQIQRGLFLILLGLFKKVAIADGVAASVNSIYNSTGTVGALDVAAATLLFCVQVYCDFSGYSDIARGVSKLLGIDLVTNFRAPFFSRSPAEYWQRWHISLSTWLRDYLFMPLVFLDPRRRIYLALMITMLVGGLWHGASWNFVLWGGFHGLLLVVHAVYRDRWPAPDPRAVRRWRVMAGIALFFTINWYSFLLFRAGSFAQIVDFTTALATGAGGMHLSMTLPALSAVLGIPVLVGLDLIEYATGDALAYRRFPAWSRGALYAFLIFVIIMGTGNEPTEFIYFQF